MSRPNARVTLLVSVVISMSAATRARQQAGVEDSGIAGYVLTPDGTPVSSGTVRVRFGMGLLTASIEPTGRFRLVPRQSGVHQLLVTVPGFVPFRLVMSVPPSRSLRLPVVRLSTGAYFRVRLVTASGEPILAPQLHQLPFDAGGEPIEDERGDQLSDPTDSDGAVVIGPLSRGILTLALDMPLFAQTRLPDVPVTDPTKNIDGGTVVIQQPGAALTVDLVDGTGAPVSDHVVRIEDPRPRSPLVFRPERTNPHGRVTFERLAAGSYRISTTAVDRCANVVLDTSRVIPISTNGTIETAIVIGGQATFRITSPLGPATGVVVSASPDVPAPPSPAPFRPKPPGCRGVTDGQGRVTLMNFPPGPAHVDVQLPNSTYSRPVEVPLGGREVAIAIPDGFLPAHVVTDKDEPARGATITWSGGGGRVQATAMATGDALLEGVGSGNGTLTASAPGYRTTEESFAEPPGVIHALVLTPLPRAVSLSARVMTRAGEPIAAAVVEFLSTDLAALPRVASTDANGVATFNAVPPQPSQLTVSADGFLTSTMHVAKDVTGEVLIGLSPGFRAIADVALPAAAGPYLVRLTNVDGRTINDMLDALSDRRIDPPGRLSLGPLGPGTYVIELQGAGRRRRESIRIVDRDVHAIIQ